MYYASQQAYASQQTYAPQQQTYAPQAYEPQQAYRQQAYADQCASPAQYGYKPQYTYTPQYGTYQYDMYAPQFGGPTQHTAAASQQSGFAVWDAAELDALDDMEELPEEAAQDDVKAKKQSKLSPGARKALSAVQNIFFWGFCIVLVVGSVLFAVSNDPKKSYLGYRTYSVKTESMTPKADGSSPPGGFCRGDMIIVKMVTNPAEIKVNDVITFNPSVKEEDNQLFLTHRVVNILTELGDKQGLWFVTKGDFNNSEDPPIPAGMLIGKKVLSIPKVGSFLQKVRENFALAIATIVCFFACIILFRWYFAKPKEKPVRAPEMPSSKPILAAA